MDAGNSLNLTGDIRFDTGAAGSKLAINALNASSRSGGEMMLDDAILLTFANDDVRMLAQGDLLLKRW